MIIRRGLESQHKDHAAQLYWDAFGGKLGKILGPEERALLFIRRVISGSHAISATSDSGELLGIAGFKTHEGALVEGGMRDLTAVYGLGAFWRAACLALLTRDVENQRFLMDGLCVTAEARGIGVGTRLLRELYTLASEKGYKEIRLDVVESNPRAKALYLREGFQAIKTERLGILRVLYGFDASTTMIRRL